MTKKRIRIRNDHVRAVDAARNRRRRALRKDHINALRRAVYAADPEKAKVSRYEWRDRNTDKVKIAMKAQALCSRAKLRIEMIAAYGATCACCGETEAKFLQLDHIYNDGAEYRRKFLTTFREWSWLRRNGWPKENHQLLCANCNFGKLLNGGICPHKNGVLEAAQ